MVNKENNCVYIVGSTHTKSSRITPEIHSESYKYIVIITLRYFLFFNISNRGDDFRYRSYSTRNHVSR